MDNQTTDGGASVDGVVNTGGGNFAGRDQHNIQNIIIVGRFLELAQVQSLLPKFDTQKPLENVHDAIEAIFTKDHNIELAEAIAFAGEILRDILDDWVSSRIGLHIALRKLIKGLAEALYEKLKLSGYWDMYRQVLDFSRYEYPRFEDTQEILFLESTNKLWEEEYNTNTSFALVYELDDNFCPRIYFVNVLTPLIAEVERWSTREQRLFLVGIILDLIRIHSENHLNIEFLRALINSLDVSSGAGKNKKA